MRAHPQIAIDGRAGVGKSTIGEGLARRLGFLYVDTGAFYRALTHAALARGLSPDDAPALVALARALDIRIIPPSVDDGRQYTVLLDGRDITRELRTPAVEAAVSRVSRHDPVRAAIIERIRQLAGAQSVVMVGRDIGAIVLPDADLKIFLKTSIAARAQRRHADLVAAYGDRAPTLATVHDEIERRDAIDAPHTFVAPDAVTIDNTNLESTDVIAEIIRLLRERGWEAPQ